MKGYKQIKTKEIADNIAINTDFTVDTLMLKMNLAGIEIAREALYQRLSRYNKVHGIIERIKYTPATYRVNKEQHLQLLELGRREVDYKIEVARSRCGKPKGPYIKPEPKESIDDIAQWGISIIGKPGTTVTRLSL